MCGYHAFRIVPPASYNEGGGIWVVANASVGLPSAEQAVPPDVHSQQGLQPGPRAKAPGRRKRSSQPSAQHVARRPCKGSGLPNVCCADPEK